MVNSSFAIWVSLISLGILGAYLITGSVLSPDASAEFYLKIGAGSAFLSFSLWNMGMRFYEGETDL